MSLAALATIGFLLLLTVPVQASADHETLSPQAGMFLVAAPGMRDPRFRRTVVLLVEHSSDGALGLIINRKTDLPVADAFPEFEQQQDTRHVLFFGGPVEPATVMYLVSDGAKEAGKEVIAGVRRGVDYDNLGLLLRSRNEDSLRIFFGYSGWGPGQLEFELSLDDWQLVPARREHIFSPDSQHLWHLLNRQTPGVIARARATRVISSHRDDPRSSNPVFAPLL